MAVFTQNFQNFSPYPFKDQSVFTTAESPVNPGQGVERNWPFSPPLCSWYLIGLVRVSDHGPAHGVPLGRGGQRREESEPQPGFIQTEPGLASERSEQAVSNQNSFFQPTLPLSSSFTGLIGNLSQEGNPLLLELQVAFTHHNLNKLMLKTPSPFPLPTS